MPRKPVFPSVINIGRRYSSIKAAASTATAAVASAAEPAVSAVFPNLHRLDLNGDPSSAPPPPARACSMSSQSQSSSRTPMLTLALTDPSFLDTIVCDGSTPLYTIETRGMKTIVTRPDYAHGEVQICCVRWPADDPKGDITVQMGRGRAKPADIFLKFGAYFTTRKFAMPDYPHTLKWRRIGKSYHLTTSAGKGNIAVLEPMTASSSPQIKVYETLYNPLSKRTHSGVPMLLLDYLVSTALLLVTEFTEFLNHAHPPSPTSTSTASASASSSTRVQSVTHSQGNPLSLNEWRRTVSNTTDSSPPTPVHSHDPTATRGHSDSSDASSATAFDVDSEHAYDHPLSHPYARGGFADFGSTSSSSPYVDSSEPTSAHELYSQRRGVRQRSASTSRASSSSSVFPSSSSFSTPKPSSEPSPSYSSQIRPASAGGRPRRQLPRLPVQPPLPSASQAPPRPTLPTPPLTPSSPSRAHRQLRLHSPPPPLPSLPSISPKLAQEKLAREKLHVSNAAAGEPRPRPLPQHSFDLGYAHQAHPASTASSSRPPLPPPPAAERDSIPPAQACEDLDDLPPPAYDSINWAPVPGSGHGASTSRSMPASTITLPQY